MISVIRSIFFVTLTVLCLLDGGLAQAADIDLQVPSYTWTPDPVVNGGTATFTITAQNNGPATSGTGTLTVALPNNVTYNAGSAKINGVPGCAYAAPNLTCSISPLALGQTATVTYTANGNGTGVQNTTATLVETPLTNNDTNTSNDSLTKSVTSIKGANLVVTHTGAAGCTAGCTATAGSNYQFTVGVANTTGPDPATTFKVVYNLPAASDFTFASTTPGAGWTCPAPVGTTLTCTYSGANIPMGGSAPDIIISGQIITTAGSITGGVTVSSTDSATGDPDLTTPSNGAITRVVTVTPGTNLQTNKTMVSNATGLTTLVNGEAATLTLSATNTGTQNASGVTITDTVSADFSIGALPGGCSAVGQAITCTVGALNAGITSASFAIPLTVIGTAGNSGTNTANVTRSGPAGGTNTPASVGYSIVAPFAKLTITKSKVPLAPASPSGASSPDPVQTGQKIQNTVVVTNSNSSTTAATGTVTVVETLSNHPNETFDAVSSAGWSCTAGTPAANQVTCTRAIAGSLARGASLPALVFTTNAVGSGMNLSNEVCTGGVISAHSPADIDAVADCSGAKTIYSTPGDVDIGITKATSDANISIGENSFDYTIVVTNHGAATAPTIVVTDDIPMYQNIAGVVPTGVAPVLAGMNAGAGENCSVNTTTGDVTCTIKYLAAGVSRTITISVTRPFKDGLVFTNTARWDSPDIVQTGSTANDTATATVQVDALADVTVTNIADAPDPVRVGMELTYTTSIKNLGASTAAGVVLRHTIDTTKMSYVAGSASLTTGGVCTLVTGFVGAPHAGANGIECSGFSLTTGESRQLTFKVIPNYSYYNISNGHAPPEAYSSDASITTTTTESNAGNNTANNVANVSAELIDIAVTKQEAMGYDPDGAGSATNLLHDPVAFGDQIKYLVTFRNNGPSLATQVVATDTLTPPPGWTANFVSVSVDASSTYAPVHAPTCTVTSGATPGTSGSPQGLTCYLSSGAGDITNSILPSGKTVILLMTFQTGGIDPPGSITFSNHATVRSAETGGAPYANDSLAGNNTVTETTTVLPKTDLYVVKTASAGVDNNGSPYNINETFNYVLTVGNRGPSAAPGVRVTDTLPAGFVRTGAAITVSAGGSVALVTNSCSGPAAGATGTVSCDLGSLPSDLTANLLGTVADAAKQVVITIPVRAAYPFATPFLTNIPNTASVAPIGGASIDPEASNNSSTVNVQIRKNSIAGTAYADNNLNDAIDGGEGISGVTITLTGTDSYGNTFGGGGSPTYAALTTTTDGSGNFLFDKLPPGNWKLVETQPGGYYDRYETTGSAGGDIPAATCDGTINCAATAAQNTIGGTTSISLPLTGTAATGYIFQEYRQAAISGNVYYDANNDGIKLGAGEVAINGTTITLSGTAYNGLNVCSLVTCATTTAAGAFSYATLPPSNGSGYTLTETQPGTHLNGKTTAGTVTGTNAVAGTATGANSDVIQAIKVFSNGASINNNFGELLPATISGYVFLDGDTNAVRNLATETAGITGLTITLTGTDDLGVSVNTPATTGASGSYSFTGLRPGTYTVTETPPTGLTHTGAQAGSLGGTINAVVRAADVGVTGAFYAISAITVSAGQSAINNNFGASGQGISGYVYADLNNNGVKDAGEPGIPGVAVTLSGTAINTVNVCTVINPNPCTLTTDSSGAYLFSGLPASNAAGYTLTEQTQASAPLSSYADGTDAKGTGIAVSGTAGNDVISGIGLVVGELGLNYNFGEIAASIAGRVYYDADDNGSFNGSDAGLGSVKITLSGTTLSGANVCTVMAVAYPTCSVNTAADGTYSFSGLPASNGAGYTLTETQPVDYADRTTTPGSVGGTATGTTVSTINLGAGVAATGYLFGEKTGSLSGYVYVDANNNGIKDGGETAISGVTLTLSGNTASGVSICAPTCPTATTAADGSYSFTGLKNTDASGYTVTETQPVSHIDGKETAGVAGGTVSNAQFNGAATYNRISAIAFNVGTAFTAYNFGELLVASISGRVYHDANNNSTYDAGEELANVSLTLSGNDDAGTAVNTTVTTAANGTYSFTNLRPASVAGYTITETQPAGISEFPVATGTMVGTINAVVTGAAALNTISSITLGSGNTGINYDFREQASSIAGIVYLDDNDDGAKGGSEPGLAGVTVTLKNAAGTVTIATTTTDTTGAFRFAGLPAATYTLEETQPASYQDGKETNGSLFGGSVDNSAYNSTAANNRISNIVLPSATNATNYLFGEKSVPVASISGRVYNDANNNSSYDAGEEIANVTLTLTGINDLGAAVNTTATTAANGTYSFTNLRPANGAGYTVTETQPATIGEFPVATGTMVGTINAVPVGSAVQNVISAITLNAGNAAINYDFREQVSSIAGFVYRDDNNDGAKDGSEAGLAGVTVALKNAAGTLTIATTTTDATGAFRFTGLAADTYLLEEIQPTSYLDGKETNGSLVGGVVDNSAYDSTAAHNRISSIVLPVTTNATNYLFGERGGEGNSSSLSGFVYVDSNNNGLKDVGETPIQNVQVTLSGTVSGGPDICSVLASCVATTDINGAFKFDGVLPGTYKLEESQIGVPVNPAYPLKDYSDGKETSGIVGGTVDNTGFGTNPGYNTISNIVVTAANITANAGNIGGYLFGERPAAPTLGLIPPIVSGYVYRDQNHDRSRDTPIVDDNAAGWTVTLTAQKSDGTTEVICQVLTDSSGFYHLDNLNCLANFPQWSNGLPTTGSAVPGSGGAITYTTFNIGFAKPGSSGVITAPQSGGGCGYGRCQCGADCRHHVEFWRQHHRAKLAA